MNLDSAAPTAAGRVDLGLESDFRLGPALVRPSALEVVFDGGCELLERRVMQVLVALARRPGAVVSREELSDCCWEGRVVGEDALNRCIARLRRLSEHHRGASFVIETIPRVGYRLVARESLAEAEAEPGASGAPTRARAERTSWTVLAARGAALGLVAALLLTLWSLRTAQPGGVTIAVLPFADLSPGRDQAYLAEGVAEEIRSVLAHDPDLRVIGRTSSALFAGPQADLRVVRSKLHATHVVEGSVRSAGDRVRVAVRLVETDRGGQVWSEAFDRRLDDVFAIQSDIGRAVAEKLTGSFNPDRRAAAARTSGQVFDLYLEARSLSRGRSLEHFVRAEALLQRALQTDPDYAPAWANLAIVTQLADDMRPGGETNSPAVLARARSYAERAIALAPHHAEGHLALGMLLQNQDPGVALGALERALEFDPADAQAWNALGGVQNNLCSRQDAIASFRRATAIEPLFRVPSANLVGTLALTADYGEAEREIARFGAVATDAADVHALRSELALSRGDLSEAVRHGRMAVRTRPPNGRAERDLAYALQALGMTEEAVRRLPREQVVIALWRGDHAAAAQEVLKAGPTIWDGWILGRPAGKALVRHGMGRELLRLYDERFPSVARFNDRFRCAMTAHAPSLILALRAAGRSAEAGEMLRVAEAWHRKLGDQGEAAPRRYARAAQLAALNGNAGGAFANLERALDLGWMNQQYPIFAGMEDPVFDPLRPDPRFQAVLGRLRAAVERERRELIAAEGSVPN